MPLEEEAESLGGKLPPETIAEVKRASIDAGLDGGMHAREHGGQGWTRVEWALVEEQFGRTTNAIHWHVPQAYNVWAHASDEHIDRYLRPALRGELEGRLRGHRARRGLGSVADRGDRRAHRRRLSGSTARSGS